MKHLIWIAAVACNGPAIVTDVQTDPPTIEFGEEGAPCSSNSECLGGLSCASNGVCRTNGSIGTRAIDKSCGATVDCQIGLICSGAEHVCKPSLSPGTGALGEGCATSADCQAGHACYADVCTGLDVPIYQGAQCGEDGGTFRVLYELPNSTPLHEDFYRLPFPNDVRRGADGIDLNGFPTFEHPTFGDLGAAWLEEASVLPAFGPSQFVFFRFSDPPDYAFAPGVLQNGAAVGAVDLTPGPTLGDAHPIGWKYRSNQRYLCDAWVGAFPSVGIPWRPGHTYAVVMNRAILKDNGRDVASGPTVSPDDDLDLLLASGAPAAPERLDAWLAMAPFREHFDALPPDQVSAVATFTVQDVQAVAQALRDTSSSSVAPTLEQIYVCAGAPGPFADVADPRRGCFDVDARFTELQGRFMAPHIQEGAPPFALPDQGGGADWSSGQPAVRQLAAIEFSLSIPNAAMPVGGFPVVLFSHGVDGNYRSAIEAGLAGDWSDLDVLAAPAPFAMLSIDTWLTGPRTGSVDPSWAAAFPPAEEVALHYANPVNPVAARDNIAQTTLDWLTAVRWLEGVDWSDAGVSPTGTSIRFDLDALHFVGQDIGALAGPVFAGHEPRIKSVVLAHTGASWIDVIAEATLPFPPAAMVGPLLGDSSIARMHPLLGIGQSIVDQVDPLNHARYLHIGAERDVLIVHGAADTYVGLTAQKSLTIGARTDQVVQAGLHAFDGAPVIQGPVTANKGTRTAVTLINGAADPHRLLTEDPTTRAQIAGFLASAYVNGVATVPQ